ncbi:glycoside hydrolase family 6 protein [Streptomyces zhihengii]|uniref:Glucanase n=1 Tax=Streptomyces zhihengii TaxID=1818004 RepID=A0ABS2UKW4_9ACTN|nr:glycoside hydrolase family 6 protein [Streptomyces zhihengii]MBM9618004.1 glycoside hydrolase family 6 protein [Streptomyces zhihengii]
MSREITRTTAPPARRRRTALLAACSLLATGAGAVAVMQTPAAAAALACNVDYQVSDWGNGFTTTVTVKNTGTSVIDGWTLTYDYAGNQQLSGGWGGVWSQSGKTVSVKNADWNKTLAAGATASPGGQFTYSGTNAKPVSFAVNGVACNGGTTPTDPPTTPPPTTPPPTDPPPAGNKVDNPFQGAKLYVNPEWKAKAEAEAGGSRISNTSTSVWLDRIAAIEGVNGGMGLRDHLDEALKQAAGQPLAINLVVYDLPGRDCAALASNGELKPDELPRYKSEFIDPIAAAVADPKYASLRITTVIEIDSLPNLVTNVSGRPTGTPQCDVMKQNGNYVKGVGYALSKLGPIANVYNYIDAGHHGWLGWDDNFGPSADLFAQAAKAEGSKLEYVTGFITNTANYGILKEPFYTINDSVNGTSVRQSKWVDWNRYVDELSYAQAFRQRLVQAGFASNIGMLIDTSRNGWGGTARPTAPGAQTSVDTYVNGGRLDRRIHLGNWCNQAGAGLGERPKAAPEPGIDAYLWVKPPGESDGAASEIPNDEGKGFDRMCDPTYTGNARNGNSMSGALGGAPVSGHWFSAQFQELMKNAYPAL